MLKRIKKISRNRLLTMAETLRNARTIDLLRKASGLRGRSGAAGSESSDGTIDVLVDYERVLESAPPLAREIYLLHRREELSIQDIAVRLQVETRVVETLLAVALLALARGLCSHVREATGPEAGPLCGSARSR